MKFCLFLSVLVCVTAQFTGFEPSRPTYRICLWEKLRREHLGDIWTPSCHWFAWNREQRDIFGRRWCVNSRTGQPVMWNAFYPREAINCQDSALSCRLNMVYDSCIRCERTCASRHLQQQCTSPCKPGCTCPSNTFLYMNRCVQESECPPLFTRPASSTSPRSVSTTTPATTTTRTTTTTSPPTETMPTTTSGVPDPQCSEPTMVYDVCHGCMRTCAQRNENLVCTRQCREGCSCPPNTFFYNGKCLLADQCPPVNCPENQVYSYCAGCDRTCENRNEFLFCAQVCRQKCTCPDGTFLDGQRCVNASECPSEATTQSATETTTTTPATTTTTRSTPPVCPENQVFSACAGCGVRCVDILDGNFPDCATTCSARCTCPSGTYLDGERCVTLDQCPPLDTSNCSDPTMVYSTCHGCVRTCAQRNEPLICAAVCRVGCTCPPNNFLLDGRCVPEDQCPPTCPENQVFSYCAGCDRTCENRNVISFCTQTCREKCTCPEGMVLDGQRCVNVSECPMACNSSLNEAFDECAPPCDATCQDQQKLCSLQESCNRRCACASGLVRNKNGVCVTPQQCPLSPRDSISLSACELRRINSEGERDVMCDENGLFNTTQCSDEECWCVNKNSGETLPGTARPIGEFDLKCDFLGDCPLHMNYQHCSTFCPPTCDDLQPRCTRQCSIDCSCEEGYVRASKTNITCVPISSCPLDPSSCFYEKLMVPGQDYLQCDNRGGYNAMQCFNSSCWCVDVRGEQMPQTVTQAPLTEANCQAARECDSSKGMEFGLCSPPCDQTCDDKTRTCSSNNCVNRCRCREGFFFDTQSQRCVTSLDCPPPLPECNELRGEELRCAPECDGTCAEPFKNCSLMSTGEQCMFRCACKANRYRNANGICVPIDECSTEMPSQRNANNEDDIVSPADCEEERTKLINSNLFDAFIPECDSNGYYESRQCYGFLNQCWCVDKITGSELDFSRGTQFRNRSLVFDINCDDYIVPPLPPILP